MALKQDEIPTTALEGTYKKFWLEFNKASRMSLPFRRVFTPHLYGSIRSYQDYAVGEPFHIVAGINFERSEVRVGAYFHDVESYSFFYELNKELIEGRMGKLLAWRQHKTKASAYVYDTVDFDENHGWENAFDVIITRMLQMREQFR
ncbi:MAG: DUF4268 domain-containing protein [Bacteroidaceae bacterium]|nr:DUF4268 domain-containing protein [Bacteroidaceae bacterium]